MLLTGNDTTHVYAMDLTQVAPPRNGGKPSLPSCFSTVLMLVISALTCTRSFVYDNLTCQIVLLHAWQNKNAVSIFLVMPCTGNLAKVRLLTLSRLQFTVFKPNGLARRRVFETDSVAFSCCWLNTFVFQVRRKRGNDRQAIDKSRCWLTNPFDIQSLSLRRVMNSSQG